MAGVIVHRMDQVGGWSIFIYVVQECLLGDFRIRQLSVIEALLKPLLIFSRESCHAIDQHRKIRIQIGIGHTVQAGESGQVTSG